MSLARLLFVSFLLSFATASAAVSLSFEKSGTDLIITVHTPVTYISEVDGNTNMVVFQGISTTVGSGNSVSSTATLSTDFFFPSVLPSLIDGSYITGVPVGSIATADTAFTSTSSHPVSQGTIVTLSTGTITLSDYEGDAPANGNYETYLLSGFGFASQAGSAVPEPSSAILLGGLVTLPLLRRRRNH